jgi:predicted phosphodiesterase
MICNIMKIQYLSDLHLELLPEKSIDFIKNSIKPKADICVLAGDIGNPFQVGYHDFLQNMNDKFKKIFIIAGNHEFYNNDILKTKLKIKSICDLFEKITFLDNSYEDYQSYRFIGSTLWSTIKNPKYTINDTSCILDLSVDKYRILHDSCCSFLDNALKNSTKNNMKSIVITHHLPIFELTHPNYRISFYENYQQWFHANIDNIIDENKKIIKAFIYGHTHTTSIQRHYDVTFYCNPLGYSHENNENNYGDINKIIEL